MTVNCCCWARSVMPCWTCGRCSATAATAMAIPTTSPSNGMRPEDWHAKAARLLGRTALECTRDRLGDAIGKEVAATAGPRPPGGGTQVVDLFAGSGNTLYWLLRHLPGSRGVGLESDGAVFRLTRHNVAAGATRSTEPRYLTRSRRVTGYTEVGWSRLLAK